MKLLLYCTKNKPYLVQGFAKPMHTLDTTNPFNYNWMLVYKGFSNDRLNGTIVAECDYEVEKFDFISDQLYKDDVEKYNEEVSKLNAILKKSCLSVCQMVHYLDTKALGTKNPNGMIGYAIHIKNLHIFDKPLSLFEISKESHYSYKEYLPKYFNAPQNMRYCWYKGEKYCLISIRPEWLRKILNGEKTIEVRKKVLKEMLNNEY